MESKVSKKKQKSYLDERTERVDKTVKELKSKHGVAYNGTQYRIWAEAFVSGLHSSTDEPPVGSMWKKAGEQLVSIALPLMSLVKFYLQLQKPSLQPCSRIKIKPVPLLGLV